MTPKGQGSLPCPNPGCPNTVDQTPRSGRPRQYCSDACGKAYRKLRHNHPETAVNDDYAVQVAEEAAQRAQHLMRLARDGEPLAALQQVVEARRDLDDLAAALVQQARDRKEKSQSIASALHISPDKLSRDLSTEANARSRKRRLERSPACPPAQPQGVPRQREPRPPAAPREASSTSDSNGPPAAPADSPAATLARALSHLHRTSGKTLRSLGKDAKVTPSYMSRIMTGERLPSWKVTRQITLSCKGDPAELRPLWEAARGYEPANPATLNAALRGLRLSAASPPYSHIRDRAHNALSLEEIRGMLEGGHVPDHWSSVRHLVSALNGQPETIRPLWDIARHSTAAPRSLALAATEVCSLPAAAFG
ncbi:helix-turn-helix domain-containing protein [Streptomyces huasconensis]|uniref:helix-turn-helix domain-containing protein n=1 Tax=Streptomyces huasconensis TaxID=1854574 RepID=UPI0034084497